MATERAQTTVDFAIGVSVFLLSAAFVFAFVPGTVQPFAGGEQEGTLVADRAANALAADLLASPERPYVLDDTCAVDFLTGSGGVPAGCPYGTRDPQTALGIGDGWSVNVTVENASGIVDADGDSLALGGAPQSGANTVAVSRRAVTFRGENCLLYVRVW